MTRFTVTDDGPDGFGRLMDGETEVMGGPKAELMRIAAGLNEDPPADLGQLRERVRLALMQTRGCSFAPGPGLKWGAP